MSQALHDAICAYWTKRQHDSCLQGGGLWRPAGTRPDGTTTFALAPMRELTAQDPRRPKGGK